MYTKIPPMVRNSRTVFADRKKGLYWVFLLAVLFTSCACDRHIVSDPASETAEKQIFESTVNDYCGDASNRVFIISNSLGNENYAEYRIKNGGTAIPTVNELRELGSILAVRDYPFPDSERTEYSYANLTFLDREYADLTSFANHWYADNEENASLLSNSDDEYYRCFTSYKTYQGVGGSVMINEAIDTKEIIHFRADARAFPEYALTGEPVTAETAAASAIEAAKLLGKETDGYAVTVGEPNYLSGEDGYAEYPVSFKKAYNKNISVGYTISVTNGGFVSAYTAYRAWYKDRPDNETVSDSLEQTADAAIEKYLNEVLPENSSIIKSDGGFSRKFSCNGELTYIKHVGFDIEDSAADWDVYFVIFTNEE